MHIKIEKSILMHISHIVRNRWCFSLKIKNKHSVKFDISTEALESFLHFLLHLRFNFSKENALYFMLYSRDGSTTKSYSQWKKFLHINRVLLFYNFFHIRKLFMLYSLSLLLSVNQWSKFRRPKVKCS